MRIGVVTAAWIFGFSSLAFAAADQPHCDQIRQACGEAGFTQGVPDGKDLTTKCFQPAMLGQKVDGVKVDSDTIKQCEDEQKAQPKKKKKRKD
jgi:hypothetical protein